MHFNSRTSCEVRPNRESWTLNPRKFQLTHLLRGATVWQSRFLAGYSHFNSRTSCEVRLTLQPEVQLPIRISTHAPLARCDMLDTTKTEMLIISTHAPLARCDAKDGYIMCAIGISTHAPLARCDAEVDSMPTTLYDFNSRTSCEVRPSPNATAATATAISTHAPLARCDLCVPHQRPGRV